MNNLIERLRMQSQHEDSVEEEAVAKIERQARRIAELESVNCQKTVEKLGSRIEKRDKKINRLERQIKRLEKKLGFWDYE